jgi:hypothetical protein
VQGQFSKCQEVPELQRQRAAQASRQRTLEECDSCEPPSNNAWPGELSDHPQVSIFGTPVWTTAILQQGLLYQKWGTSTEMSATGDRRGKLSNLTIYFLDHWREAGDRTMKLGVRVQFSGVVTVEVPDHLSSTDAKILATKVALARILATCDNPDAREDDTCSDYVEESSGLARSTADEDWGECKVRGVGGQWSVR